MSTTPRPRSTHRASSPEACSLSWFVGSPACNPWYQHGLLHECTVLKHIYNVDDVLVADEYVTQLNLLGYVSAHRVVDYHVCVQCILAVRSTVAALFSGAIRKPVQAPYGGRDL